MRLHLHTNQLPIRILGTVTGLGFLALGAFAVFGPDESVAAAARERALWFGITALIGGVWAVGVSWLDSDLSGVWCRPPRKPRDLRPPR